MRALVAVVFVTVVGGLAGAADPVVIEPVELEYLPAVMIGKDGQKEAQANFEALAKKYDGKLVRYTGTISEQGRPRTKGKDEEVVFTIKNKSGKSNQSSAIEFVVEGDYKPLATAIKDNGKATVTVEGVFTATATKAGVGGTRVMRITGKVVETK